MNYILDTSAYSQLVRGHTAAAHALRTAENVYVPQMVIAELRYGFQLGGRLADNERLLQKFLAAGKVRALFTDAATTDYFVAIAVHVRRTGVQLATHDLWIAALAHQWGATLLTYDRDFAHLGYNELQLQYETIT